MDAARRDTRAILADIKRLAVEYHAATGRPLGATGELAEFEATDKLGLELAAARVAGYDATRRIDGRIEKIQIKGRRVARGTRYRGQMPAIKLTDAFDAVILVLLDAQYEAIEMWEASRDMVTARLDGLSSATKKKRGVLVITQFISIADRVWPA